MGERIKPHGFFAGHRMQENPTNLSRAEAQRGQDFRSIACGRAASLRISPLARPLRFLVLAVLCASASLREPAFPDPNRWPWVCNPCSHRRKVHRTQPSRGVLSSYSLRGSEWPSSTRPTSCASISKHCRPGPWSQKLLSGMSMSRPSVPLSRAKTAQSSKVTSPSIRYP